MQTAQSGARRRLEGARVLLLEDDPHTAHALQSVLSRLGCVVVHAGLIEQARQHLREGEFDLALLDVDLPDGSGLDVVLHLRNAGSPCAALVLTGSRLDRHLREAVGLGVTDYLLKPVDAQELASGIERAMEQTELMRQWLRRQPSAAHDAPLVTPTGLGRSAADLVRKLAVQFDLTDRQADALTLVAEGHRDAEIARRLGISYSRVRQLLSGAFLKTGLTSRNDLIRYLAARER